ncbi:MAG: hypothetical protein M1832_000305 [Thelocarpon impressellum]|nr:MAG: hypothetical protein M1832_000305 [Thelocarpon impressellum]
MSGSSSSGLGGAGQLLGQQLGESSNSSTSGHRQTPAKHRSPLDDGGIGDDDDDDDPVAQHARAQTLLSSDPLEGELRNSISFKRKQRPASGLAIPRFLSSPLSSSRQVSPSPRTSAAGAGMQAHDLGLGAPRSGGSRSISPAPNRSSNVGGKDGGPSDWYVEGPGRRVGYDDMTAIDWIFEYTKERQRLSVLRSSATGLLGQLQQLLDASQVWWVLIGTGLAVGVLAASIDVASDWLGDLKMGYCRSGQGGGKFYLNKAFCCWGLEEWSQCQDWTPWSAALHVGSKSGAFLVQYIFFVLYSILFAACASILVQTYAIYAKHSGIPEIKTVLGGFVIRRFMGTWTLVIKSLGLCLAVASGLWLGKEGPLVHVACCCANVLMKPFDTLSKNEARKREVLSAAAASGISVAFGSPIGGVLFSLEQLSYYFPDKTMWQSFVCAMVAAVTLQAFNPFRTGKLVLYQVTYSSGWHGFEMVPFLILGITGGLYGGLFIRLNMKIAEWRKSTWLSKSPVVEVVLVALITALINYPNVFMRAQSSELVYSLFAECSAVPDDQFGLCKTSGGGVAGTVLQLLAAAVLGFFLASITFGLEIPAGIILPSMAIGALYGRALGVVVEAWQRAHPAAIFFAGCEPDKACVTPGTYAIIGAASALSGVTRLTVSIVVITFELTGALTYVLPIMIAVMVSKWVGDGLGRRGIYESWIHHKEYPFLDNRDEAVSVPDVPAAQLMTRIEDLVVLTATGHTIETLLELLATQPHRGFPVIADTRDALLLGYISRTELAYALDAAMSPPRSLPRETETFLAHQALADPRTTLDLRPWVDQTPLTLSGRSSLQLTVGLFQKLGLRYVLFCERGLLQGLLTKKDVWYVLNGRAEDEAGPRSGGDGDGDVRAGRGGVLREEGTGEERGLLGDNDGSESPQSGR